jgi:protein RecA
MSIEALAKSLTAAIGDNSENQGVANFVSTGFLPLNKIISGEYSGGLPQGRMVEMYGPSSSGKTALATMMMIQAQKAGGIAGFMDHERSFDIGMAKNMGLNDTFPHWIYKQPATWEESNTLMAKAAKTIREAKVIDPNAPILFVFDSVAAARPKSTVEKEFDEYNMNDTTALARVTSTTLKSMAAFTEMFNFTVLYLNQIRTKPGVVYGDPTTTPGGVAMEFYSTVRIALGRKKIMEDRGGEKVFVAQEISMKTTKNKLTRPFQEITWRMGFNEDGSGYFDVTTSMIDVLIANGKLASSGARVTWTDGKSYFKKALAKHIDENGLQGELNKLLEV